MDIRQAYNAWAEQYDTNQNKTRDLEAISLRSILNTISFDNCLEIGCGTGKNTEWLITKAKHVTAVDLSEEMLSIANQKNKSEKVTFLQADITKEWTFADKPYDLVTFSLVLEHIENLSDIFRKASSVTRTNGNVYIGELHPFKQYLGTKAKFETSEGLQIVDCFNHHISDFTQTAKQNGFEIVELEEFFDTKEKSDIPRILTILLKKH